MSQSASPSDSRGITVLLNADATGGLMVGEPALFDRQMKLVEEPTEFLRRHYVESGRRASRHTWRDAAFTLAGWLEFLDAIGVSDWRLANVDDLIRYRDAHISSISPSTRRSYAPGTIANRVSIVEAFYRRAIEWKWYEGVIGKRREYVRRGTTLDGSSLSHLGPNNYGYFTSGLSPKRVSLRTTVHPFMIAELTAFLQAIGPRFNADSSPQGVRSRDRLIVDLALFVGLRVDEIHQLTRYQFESMCPDDNAPGAEQPLSIVGKGRKRRVVAIPNWLVADALTYIETYRAASSRANKRQQNSALILSGLESNRPGRDMSHRRYQQIVESACIQAGITIREKLTDPATNRTICRVRASHSIHDLRHTYAVLTYWAEKKNGNSEPWKKIQAQLGHSQLSTTVNTYLSFVEIFAAHKRMFSIHDLIGRDL